MELGKYPEALECFEQVIRLEPGDNMAWYNRGYVLMILEEYQEAVNTFDLFLARYSKKDDFYKYALYMKAKGLYSLKKYDESLKLTKRLLKRIKIQRSQRTYESHWRRKDKVKINYQPYHTLMHEVNAGTRLK